MTYNFGVTATREGLSAKQLHVIVKKFIHIAMTQDIEGVDMHHGCCVGGDEQLAIAAYALGIGLVAHPPDNPTLFSKLAYDLSVEKREPAPYLERNRTIVKESEYVIAGPKEDHLVVRSGTWATIRYAKTANKGLFVILPDGREWTTNV